MRLVLIPVMLWTGLSSNDGVDAVTASLFAVIAWSDYADGMAARITGQYSRLGSLLDPLVDRMLVIGGLIICWKFELLPRWAIVVVIVRELYVIWAARMVLRRGIAIHINWSGRLAVWPTMSAIFAAMVGLDTVALVLLYIGIVLSLIAAAAYTRDAWQAHRTQPRSGH